MTLFTNITLTCFLDQHKIIFVHLAIININNLGFFLFIASWWDGGLQLFGALSIRITNPAEYF